jgi:hypothetical protein
MNRSVAVAVLHTMVVEQLLYLTSSTQVVEVPSSYKATSVITPCITSIEKYAILHEKLITGIRSHDVQVEFQH